MKKGTMLSILAVIAVLVPALALAGALQIPQGAMCAGCGMSVDPASRTACQIVDGRKMLPFCDVGDMLDYYKKMDNASAEVYVKDYASNSWTDGRSAYYVKDASIVTPMGWGIVAFADEARAKEAGMPMSFEQAVEMAGGGSHGMKHKMKMKM